MIVINFKCDQCNKDGGEYPVDWIKITPIPHPGILANPDIEGHFCSLQCAIEHLEKIKERRTG